MSAPRGGDPGGRPLTVRDALRAGAGLLAARPLAIARIMGSMAVVALACFAWGGLSGAVRGALEWAFPGGWVSRRDGESGNPFAVMVTVLAIGAAGTAAAWRARRSAEEAWRGRRIGRRRLALVEALPAAVALFGLGLAVVAAMVALGADRGGLGVFAVRPASGVAAGLLGLILVWGFGWVRTLFVPRGPGAGGAEPGGAGGGSSPAGVGPSEAPR